MIEKFCDYIKEKWLSPSSSIVMFIVLVIAYAKTISIINEWKIVKLDIKLLSLIVTPFLLVEILYVIACYLKWRLPCAPKDIVAILFCIDAENEKLFKTAEYKLVNNFNSTIKNTANIRFKAICVPSERVAKYDLSKENDALKLLECTNCIFLVRVRYTADNADNAENFELKIDYGVQHPEFDQAISNMLSRDMTTLNASIGRQRFVKANAIEVFNFTTQSLVCISQYILGVVALFSGENNIAINLLEQSKKSVTVEFVNKSGEIPINIMIEDRIFEALCKIADNLMVSFQKYKSPDTLGEMCKVLQMANQIRPDTYFYNMNMAYAYIILDHDVEAAKKCIKKCKLSKLDTAWRYSDAFLSAYQGHTPRTIISKYNKAFRSPYKSLSQIAEYIEIVLDNEPHRNSLHLAAALVYEEMGDVMLMKNHFTTYLETAVKIDDKSKGIIEVKINKGICGVPCNHRCSNCENLIA